MALTPYTTPGDVRAVLGISEDELEDDSLNLAVYELSLKRELRLVSPSILANFPEWEASDDAMKQLAYGAAKLFATYAVAKELCVALPMLAPKSIGDGKANLSRFSDAPYRDTIDRVEAAYHRAKDDLTAAVAEVAGEEKAAGSAFSILRVSKLNSDPVIS